MPGIKIKKRGNEAADPWYEAWNKENESEKGIMNYGKTLHCLFTPELYWPATRDREIDTFYLTGLVTNNQFLMPNCFLLTGKRGIKVILVSRWQHPAGRKNL